MDGLGLSVPPFTGKPWWTTSYDVMDCRPLKTENVTEECTSSSAKRHKLDCDDEPD